MPSAQLIVKVANGSSILLGPQDRVVKEITINCESPRCASRHGQDKPVEFTFDDGGNFPEAGDSFLSLILPARSPSNVEDRPRCFCSPACLKDYLTYAYLAPSPRQPEPNPPALTAEQLTGLNSQEFDAGGPPNVRKTDSPAICGNYKEYVGDGIGCDKPPDHEDNCGKKDGGSLPEPTVIGQADGYVAEGENPKGPSLF